MSDAKVAVKNDGDKWRMSLMSCIMIREVGRVLEFGARKYAIHNWRKGFNWTRLFDACQRHLIAWMAGESIDPESKLPHLAHAICNLMFLLEFQFTGKGVDDRFPVPEYLSVD